MTKKAIKLPTKRPRIAITIMMLAVVLSGEMAAIAAVVVEMVERA